MHQTHIFYCYFKSDIKPILLRFKLEIYQLQTAQKRRIYRINFIQQQGMKSIKIFFFSSLLILYIYI